MVEIGRLRDRKQRVRPLGQERASVSEIHERERCAPMTRVRPFLNDAPGAFTSRQVIPGLPGNVVPVTCDQVGTRSCHIASMPACCSLYTLVGHTRIKVHRYHTPRSRPASPTRGSTFTIHVSTHARLFTQNP